MTGVAISNSNLLVKVEIMGRENQQEWLIFV